MNVRFGTSFIAPFSWENLSVVNDITSVNYTPSETDGTMKIFLGGPKDLDFAAQVAKRLLKAQIPFIPVYDDNNAVELERKIAELKVFQALGGYKTPSKN